MVVEVRANDEVMHCRGCTCSIVGLVAAWQTLCENSAGGMNKETRPVWCDRCKDRRLRMSSAQRTRMNLACAVRDLGLCEQALRLLRMDNDALRGLLAIERARAEKAERDYLDLDEKIGTLNARDRTVRNVLDAREGEITQTAAVRVATARQCALETLIKTDHAQTVGKDGCKCLTCKAIAILEFGETCGLCGHLEDSHHVTDDCADCGLGEPCGYEAYGGGNT